MPLINRPGAVTAATALLWCQPLSAAINSEYRVGITEEWTDNVYFASSDKRHDLISELFVGVDFSNDERSPHQYGMEYQFTREEYLRDSFGGTNYLEGAGYADVELLPQRLFWNSTVVSSVTQRNSSGPDDPDNRDQRNTVSTGVDYNLVSGIRDTLSLGVEATAVRFRETDGSSDRYSADASWVHRFNRLTSGGFSCTGEDVNFRDQDNEDYESVQCLLTLSRQLVRGSVAMEAGRRAINPATGETVDGLSYNLNFSWLDGPHRLSVVATRDITDTTVGLDSDLFVGGIDPLDQNTDITALTLRKRVEMSYGYRLSGSSEVEALVYRDSDDIYDSTLDNDREGVYLGYTRQLTRDTELSLKYDYGRSETALDSSRSSVDYNQVFQILGTRIFSRHFDVSLGLTAERQDGKQASRDYEVYSVMGTLFYRF
ncbi:MAG: hypothetical protein CML06_05055 [Pseudomonadales bacterium]|nr:hypothetical protein [Pseudomonadales bacterium]